MITDDLIRERQRRMRAYAYASRQIGKSHALRTALDEVVYDPWCVHCQGGADEHVGPQRQCLFGSTHWALDFPPEVLEQLMQKVWRERADQHPLGYGL